MPRSVSQERWADYRELRVNGASRSGACSRLSISYDAAAAFDRGDPRSSGYDMWRRCCRGIEPFATEARAYATNVMPLGHDRNLAIVDAVEATSPVGPRSDIARAALDDFHLFRPRYMGRIATGTQVDAAEQIVEWLEDPEDTFGVMNCPPGWGKSTLIVDIEAWLTARWRGIRGMNGSRSEWLAAQNTGRLRRFLEADLPLPGAMATLAEDFGPFKPPTRQKWTDAAFVVYQDSGRKTMEREPTWTSLGMDTRFMGTRANLISWDDLVDPDVDLRSIEAIQRQRDFLDDKAETRLEPGGLFLVTMQRLSPEDLSRFCLDQRLPLDDAVIIDTGEDDPRPRKYHHIVFRAHDEERCEGLHGKDAPAQPEGCLLDPVRLSWPKLMAIKENRESKYRIQYQQEDVDPESVLVHRDWLRYDPDRSCWSPLPETANGISVITVDPSGTQRWAVQAWHYVPDGDDGLGGRRYLLDLRNRPMQAPELLERDEDYFQVAFTGLLEEWRRNFAAIGRPLKVVIFEVNAFARWLTQFKHATRWAEVNGVTYLKHTTGVMKMDFDKGIWSHQSQWRFGRIILPGATPADIQTVKPLAEQVTRWPQTRVIDQVMAWYFLEAKLTDVVNLRTAMSMSEFREERPSWMLNPALLAGMR